MPKQSDTPVFRKGGRPRLDELEKRGACLRVRVRPDELAAIEQRAASINQPLADFIREQAMFGRILVRQSRSLSAVDRHDLARIGTNLNQIARACNATGETARARGIERLLDELRDVLSRLSAAGSPGDELGQG